MTPGTRSALALVMVVLLALLGHEVGPVLGLSADPLRPCATAAGPASCYWDAGKRGGRRSFILWDDGTTEYL